MADVQGIVAAGLSSLKESGAVTETPDGALVSSTEAPETETSTPVAADPAPGTETTAPAAAKPAEKPAPTPEELEEQEILAAEQELLKATPNLGKNKLTSSRHQAVVTRMRNKLKAEHDEALKPLKELADKYTDPDVQRRIQLMDLAETDPDKFVEQVLLKDATYQKVLQARIDKALEDAGVKKGAAPGAATVAATLAARPEPDVLHQDGSVGYSAEKARELSAWEAQEAVRPVLDKLAAAQAELQAVKQSIDPLLSERQHSAQFQERLRFHQKKWETAVKEWPGFADHEQAVVDFFAQNKTKGVTIEDAYRAVVVPKLKGEDPAALKARLRKEIEAEIAKAPAIPARLSATGTVPVANGQDHGAPKDISDIVRQASRDLLRPRA